MIPKAATRVLEPGELREALALLEEFLREGEPLPEPFIERTELSMRRGDLYVIAATSGEEVVGVLTLTPRPSIALGGAFASIEDLYVSLPHRRLGFGRAMLSRALKLCGFLGMSYVEVQVESKGAGRFYSSAGFESEAGVAVMSLSQASGAENSSTS